MKTIWYASAPCGAGKTFQLVERALGLCSMGAKVLIAQPTNRLAAMTKQKEFDSRQSCPAVTVFNSDTMGRGIAKQLAEYLAAPPDDDPEVVICTHQVLAHLPFLTSGLAWDLLIDECPQVDRECRLNVRDTHGMITDLIRAEHYNAKYSRVTVNDEEALKEIAYNKHGDEVYDVLQEVARVLVSRHWETFVHREQYESLRDGSGQALIFHSVLDPGVVSGFRSVFICGANFEESAVYKLWRPEVQWRRSSKFESDLRYTTHKNGHLLTIYNGIDGNWSTVQRDRSCEGKTNLVQIGDAAAEILKDRPFVWQANKAISEKSFAGDLFAPDSRLPNNPLGLNEYTGIHDLVFLSALNPSPAHCAFLKDRGVRPEEIAAMQYLETLYQSVMRISLRDPEDRNPKTVIVPDLRAARYLAEKLPGASIRKLKSGIREEIKKPGRMRIHASDVEKASKHREAKREEKRKHLFKMLLPAQDHGDSCKPNMRNENTISITSDFVTDHPCWGTFYKQKTSKDAIGYLRYGSVHDFIEVLEFSSKQSYLSKESIPLLSPATFDPAKAQGTNRGIANIVFIQNLFLDFENGDLPPTAFPELFPDLMMVVTNTYQHTKDNPRFRVVIITDRPVQPEIYGIMIDEIEARLEEHGYVGKPLKNSNFLRSGLDPSKKTPASLFRLPCQARKASDSFFSVYTGGARKPLNPEEWLKVARISIPEDHYVEAPTIQPTLNAVDPAKVQRAVEQCKSAARGAGNHEFFMLAVRLENLGMDLDEIEFVLRTVAPSLRSPDERRRQIPSIIQFLKRNRRYARA